MTDQALLTDRLQELTSLYERNAYLVYNVARRTAVDPEAARRAARRAFMGQVAAIDEDRLATDAARVAIEEAPALNGTVFEDPVEGANAKLPPVARAALALTALRDAEVTDLAAVLGLSESAASDVLGRANDSLAVQLRTSPEAAADSYRDQDWIEPPAELWAELYPDLHTAVAQTARSVSAADEAPPPPPRRRRSGPAPRLPRRAIALALAALAAGAVVWQVSDSGGGGSDADVSPSSALPGESDARRERSGGRRRERGPSDDGPGRARPVRGAHARAARPAAA
jgi:hypothetical protein